MNQRLWLGRSSLTGKVIDVVIEALNVGTVTL